MPKRKWPSHRGRHRPCRTVFQRNRERLILLRVPTLVSVRKGQTDNANGDVLGGKLHPLGRGDAEDAHAVPEDDLRGARQTESGSGYVLRLFKHMVLVIPEVGDSCSLQQVRRDTVRLQALCRTAYE